MPAPRIMSDDEDDRSVSSSPRRGGSPEPQPRGLFSDGSGSEDEGRGGRRSRGSGSRSGSDDDDDDDRGRGRDSQAEESDGDGGKGRRPGGSGSQSQRDGGDKNTDDEEEEERKREEKRKKEAEKKKKPKGPVRRQMISEDMLTGPKGVIQLPELFKDFQFGGKGREKEDLGRIMSKLEHWVHLLHPKQPFDQSLQRIEFLGLKRKVMKTHLKKLRMGLLNDYEVRDEIIEDDDDDGEDFEAMEAEASSHPSSGVAVTQPQQPGPPGPSSSRVLTTAPDDDFPDDDELFEMMREAATTTTTSAADAGKENAPPQAQKTSTQQRSQPDMGMEDDEEMDIDMDIDMDDFGGEEDFLDKQLEAQLKRASEMEAKAKEADKKNADGHHDEVVESLTVPPATEALTATATPEESEPDPATGGASIDPPTNLIKNGNEETQAVLIRSEEEEKEVSNDTIDDKEEGSVEDNLEEAAGAGSGSSIIGISTSPTNIISNGNENEETQAVLIPSAGEDDIGIAADDKIEDNVEEDVQQKLEEAAAQDMANTEIIGTQDQDAEDDEEDNGISLEDI